MGYPILTGQGVTFTAHAFPGSVFEGYYDESGLLVSSNPELTVTCNGYDRDFTARFHAKTPVIEGAIVENDVDVCGSGIGTISGTGTFEYGATATLTASLTDAAVQEGYVFTGWTDARGNTVTPVEGLPPPSPWPRRILPAIWPMWQRQPARFPSPRCPTARGSCP